ncbi:MAG: DUF6788 family protein [Candidatus Omnitrophota bacterium]
MSKIRGRKRGRLPAINDVIRGSAVIMERVCGSSSCRCLKGHKHRSLYISQYHKGSPRMVYIPKGHEKKVLRLVDNYRVLKAAIYKASELNLGRLMAGAKET